MGRIPGKHFLRILVERRALVAQLVRRDFETRYKGSAAGWLWGVVHPLVMLASYAFVFQICLKQTVPAESPTQNYTIFMFCGYLPWMLFQETVSRCANSLVEQSNLITKTVFPSEVVPVSIFLASLIHHLIGVSLVLVGVLWVQKVVHPMIALLPLYMFFLGLLAVGVGWVVSSLHVYLRDTGQMLSVVLQVWFWMTPIMITEDLIPKRFHIVIDWNPMAWVVRAYRDRLLSGAWPHLHDLSVLAAYSIAVFVAGGLFFRHLKRGFADVL
jgi:ABC-type polysaccharide/polyol phosphate export permease